MFDYSRLYGKIREVFGTQEAFADAMDMSRSAMNQRLTGAIEWKSPEIVKACELLGIPIMMSWMYFFTLKSRENTTEE